MDSPAMNGLFETAGRRAELYSVCRLLVTPLGPIELLLVQSNVRHNISIEVRTYTRSFYAHGMLLDQLCVDHLTVLGQKR